MVALSKNFPVRLHRAVVFRPIWILNVIFPIVRLFLSKKMQERINNVGHDVAAVARAGHLRLERIPAELGGSLEDWIDAGSGVDAWVKEEEEKFGGAAAVAAASVVDTAAKAAAAAGKEAGK